MTHPAIRFANEEDCQRILEIYAPYILDSAISFETEVPTLEDFKTRFQEITAKYPWIVFEEDNQIIGYAYASSHRSRCAYGWSCEVTVYIDEKHHKRGIGTQLYEALFPILKAQGFYNLFAGVTQPNEGSNTIHKRLGFQEIGTYRNIGYKFGKWHDVSWYQLEVNSGGVPTVPFSIHSLLREKVQIVPLSPGTKMVFEFVRSLDDYLESLYPSDENFLDSPDIFTKSGNQLFGAFAGELLVGIGAIKLFEEYGEIKRMWVPPLYRGFGIAKKILAHLENQIKEQGRYLSRLETGDQQREALGLYKAFGYYPVEPFGDYKKNNSSLFMEKAL
jgi:L-amino acid N-acyltransferase YncA